MTDSYGDPQQFGGQGGRDGGRDGGREGGRDGARRRGAGNREGGGFRIRLSDNEMRSVRALQEAFNLRSTVAVLGFAVRTLGQMLEDGQLDALIEQQKAQAPRGGGNRRGEGRGEGSRFGNRSEGGGRGNRPDPFARPAKPQVAPAEDPSTTGSDDPSNSSEVETAAVETATDAAADGANTSDATPSQD